MVQSDSVIGCWPICSINAELDTIYMIIGRKQKNKSKFQLVNKLGLRPQRINSINVGQWHYSYTARI